MDCETAARTTPARPPPLGADSTRSNDRFAAFCSPPSHQLYEQGWRSVVRTPAPSALVRGAYGEDAVDFPRRERYTECITMRFEWDGPSKLPKPRARLRTWVSRYRIGSDREFSPVELVRLPRNRSSRQCRRMAHSGRTTRTRSAPDRSEIGSIYRRLLPGEIGVPPTTVESCDIQDR